MDAGLRYERERHSRRICRYDEQGCDDVTEYILYRTPAPTEIHQTERVFSLTSVRELLAAREPESTDPGTPVETAGALQILGCEVEGALVARIDGHRTVVAPSV